MALRKDALMSAPTHTGLVLDDIFLEHDTGAGHPERPDRLNAVRQALTAAGLAQRCRPIEPRAAELDWILANHDRAYIDRLADACAAGDAFIDCADSAICRESYRIALVAAGSVLAATDAVARSELSNAFCAVRPPGHHAERDRSMGFCMFNNVAIAARFLRATHHCERIVILDWDVHHGNGTQHVFEDDPSVLFISIHGDPAVVYPGTGYAHERGRGAGVGATINVPLAPGSGDAVYREVFRDTVEPAIRTFAPQFVLLSCGFDAHRADPLAPLNLDTASFGWMSEAMLEIAADHCAGQLVSILEGGYDLNALGESAALHVERLLGSPA